MLPVCIKLKACHDDASFNLIEKANDIKQYHQSTKHIFRRYYEAEKSQGIMMKL